MFLEVSHHLQQMHCRYLKYVRLTATLILILILPDSAVEAIPCYISSVGSYTL